MQDALYRILAEADPQYVEWLKDSPYRVEGKTLRMFAVSGLRVPRAQREFAGKLMVVTPGERTITWEVSSPMPEFIERFQRGLERVRRIQVDDQFIDIVRISAQKSPSFPDVQAFSCMSPIVAFDLNDDGTYHYLRSHEYCAWNANLYADLVQKYRILHGSMPAPSPFELTWDQGYLSRNARKGQKRIVLAPDPVHRVEVVGCMAPFTLRTSNELMRVAYLCGLGERNSLGLGMIDPR